jgi:Exonuclease VII, large subunit
MFLLDYKGPGYLPLCLRSYGDLILANNMATLLEGTRLCRRAVLGADRQAPSSADLYGSERGEQCTQAPVVLDTPYAVLAWHYPLHYPAQPNVTKKRLLWALDVAARIGMDEVVLARGGGDPANFAVFDDGDVVDAVLRSPVPVIAALGHTSDVPAVARVATACLAVPHDVRHLDRMRFQIAYGREAAIEEALRFLAHSGFSLG